MKRIIFALLVLILCAQCTPDKDIELISLTAEAKLTYTETTDETIDDGEISSRTTPHQANLTLDLGLSSLSKSITDQISTIEIDTKTTDCENTDWTVRLSESDNEIILYYCPPPIFCPGIITIDDALTGDCLEETDKLGYDFMSMKEIQEISILLKDGRTIPVNLKETIFIVR